MKVIKLSPEEVEVKEVENTLEELQSEVDGYIETLYLGNGYIIICNEEGKLRRLPVTAVVTNGIKQEPLVGNILICKIDEENFISLSEEDIKLILEDKNFKRRQIRLTLFQER